MTIDQRNAYLEAALAEPTFAALASACIARGLYLDILADKTEDDTARINLHGAATRAISEAVKAMRHKSKDDLQRLVDLSNRREQARDGFALAKAAAGRAH